MICTIAQLQKVIQNSTLLKGSFDGIIEFTFKDVEKYEYIADYLTVIDKLLALENGSMDMLRQFWIKEIERTYTINNEKEIRYVVDDEQLGLISTYLKNFMDAHEWEIKKMIGTLNFEYNPIDNVAENTTEIYRGDGTENEDAKRALTYGIHQTRTNDNYGTQTLTSSGTNTEKIGNTGGEYTTTHNVSPFDDDIFHSDTQDHNFHSEDASENSGTTSNSETRNQYEDTHTTTRNARDDKDNLDRDVVTTTSYTKQIIRHGNIGVTSSQQLIQSEREIAQFSIAEYIKNLIVGVFLVHVYQSPDYDCACARWEENYAYNVL